MTIKDLISIRTAADIVKMHPQTVRKWVKSGELQGVRINNGPIRVSRDELLALARPVNPEPSDGVA
ncbi:helix-turn-helix domain-containing protein [Nocardia sp. NPDC056000]|uniref:helix-turn-helix domain-containing protein n=1 Tax=Nocardia sp. NPDC056000 TaxID=3345674 RepID=UPI0035E1DEDC